MALHDATLYTLKCCPVKLPNVVHRQKNRFQMIDLHSRTPSEITPAAWANASFLCSMQYSINLYAVFDQPPEEA